MTKPEINVTPLIDVLLVLLIIFMVVSPMKPSKFEAKIPQPPDDMESGPRDPAVLIVEIRSDGSLMFNGDTVYSSPAELSILKGDIQRKLEQIAETGSDNPLVFIKAPKSMSYGNVIRVVDSIKSAGNVRLGLQIDRLSG